MGVVVARAALTMPGPFVAIAISLGFTLASAFASPVGVAVLQNHHIAISGLTSVAAMEASGTGCAVCIAVVVLLYAIYCLVDVASKLLSNVFCCFSRSPENEEVGFA
ncbi:hypothetical protein BD309DRAFT_553754 [Dichomitus squalens]|nr:hypothetical protein BD309DRAFT_553754 [Dichomitus squalens]